MSSLEELVEAKNKQRAILKREYLKQLTNPHAKDVGHIFDPAVQRFLSMKATRIEFFRETPKTAMMGFMYLVLPFALTFYMLKSDRDAKEATFRSGEVSYKDRRHKFI